MDKHGVYRTITFNRSCNVLKVNPSEKKKKKENIRCETYAKTGHIELKTLFQLSAFHEEIHAFEDWIFCQIIDFDRFMTPEGSDMLILPFTSKTGQSIPQNYKKSF